MLSLIAIFASISSLPLGNNFQKGKGVLIHPKVVLTAAHVVDTKNTIFFNHKHTGKVFCHPSYNKNNIAFDIALFILDEQTMDTFYPLSLSPPLNDVFFLPHPLYYGDSGTALIKDGEVVAIACAIVGENNQNYEVVYLSIYPYLDWIQKIMREQL